MFWHIKHHLSPWLKGFRLVSYIQVLLEWITLSCHKLGNQHSSLFGYSDEEQSFKVLHSGRLRRYSQILDLAGKHDKEKHSSFSNP